ncbi:MAG: MBL fold metallo-hydrolase [Pseudomonadota bacterium]
MIDYVFDFVPEPGSARKLDEGLYWLRMPLPIRLNHINLWVLEDGDGWTLVDTGMFTDESKQAWRSLQQSLFGHRPVHRVVCTHLHPDHVGCAGWLTREHDCDLWMTREEYMLCRLLVADTGREAPEEGVRFYRRAGFSEDALAAYRNVFGFFGRYVSKLPEAYHRIEDKDVIEIGERRWSVVIGKGHSPEHACLYDRDNNVLIAGDQLLPTISSNVGVYPTEPDANPLQRWFASLRRLKSELHEDVLVLPAHGKPFRGAHARLDALIDEHQAGLNKLIDLCREPMRAIDVFPALFRSKVGPDNLIIATGEALAHLHYLVEDGELERVEVDGVYKFRRR